MSYKTPKSFRLHIGLFGRRNVGKSSLLNAVTGQQVSIVSPIAGTTTDLVEKPMEMLPLGPVLWIDTAGLDDTGFLGDLRVQKTRSAFDRADIGVLVTDGWGEHEESTLAELSTRKVPVLVVFNKTDEILPDPSLLTRLQERKIPVVQVSCISGTGIGDFRQAILKIAPEDYLNQTSILSDLVPPGEMAVLVVPIDKEAPKGRLILPQAQAIRDLLDHNAFCMVVRETELLSALAGLKQPPRLVVTDSQAFQKVAQDTPRDVWLTSFSILFSRFKGDLVSQVQGTRRIDALQPGERVLIAEACSHHPIGEDIGRVKIPRWLHQYAGGELVYDFVQGHDFPADLTPWQLVIQCGACMLNRREMLNRILRCREAGVPITNYGLVIAKCVGILERALEPFPAALEALYQNEYANLEY